MHPHALKFHWDKVWAPGWFPGQYCLRRKDRGVGLAQATCVFDPSAFAQDEGSRQMRYRPTVDGDFWLLVVLHHEGRIETFKYRGSEVICETCGPDFQTAMIHTAVCGLAPDEPWTTKIRVGELSG